MILVLSLLGLAFCSGKGRETVPVPSSVPGPAGELTPSKSHYFDWINSQYEGTTEAQTLANMEFFQWLHDEFGLTLDVYSLDVGNIDDGPYTAGVGRLIPYHYGTLDSEEFRAQFPRGFALLVKKAAGFGGRLGVWMGPDGFGDTSEEEKARADMLVSLCRDYNFIAFKIDAVAGQLRPEKQEVFRRTVEACRSYRPDLMIQNHRVKLGAAAEDFLLLVRPEPALHAPPVGHAEVGNHPIETTTSIVEQPLPHGAARGNRHPFLHRNFSA